jgi:DNA-binding GntR family transcriptional regulator
MPRVKKQDPAYLQVSQYLRQRIQKGDLKPEAPVPSVRQLAAEWGIAKATAERAIATLRDEGLLESRPGIGMIVSSKRAMSSAEWLRNVRMNGQIYPSGQRSHKIVANLWPANEEIARALGTEVGETVVRRHRVTLANDEIISVSTSYLPGHFAEVAPPLLKMDRLDEGTIGCIEKFAGVTVVEVIDERSARAARPDEARELGVDEGAPVLAGRNWWLDEEGKVLEYGESIEPEGRWVRLQFTRDHGQ